MANTAQSKKRARQSETRFAINKARRSRIRTFVRKVEEAIASGNGENLATINIPVTASDGDLSASGTLTVNVVSAPGKTSRIS